MIYLLLWQVCNHLLHILLISFPFYKSVKPLFSYIVHVTFDVYPGRRSGDESSSDVDEDSDEEDAEQSSDEDAEDQGSSVDDDDDNESSDDDHDNIDGASDGNALMYHLFLRF